MERVTQEFGPPEAPVLFIGEIPSKGGVKAGKPFMGQSGQEARRALRMAGLHDVGEVLWTHTVGVNASPDGKLGSQLLKEWAPRLDNVIEHSDARVVVLCGGQALKRLTGLTSIMDWTGSVLKPEWLKLWLGPSGMIDLGHGFKHPLVLPRNCEAIIPVLDPAGYINTKGKDNLPIFYRGIEKVGKVVKGTLETYPFKPIINPSLAILNAALKEALGRGSGKITCAFDTEFNPETGELYDVGLTFDGNTIYSYNWQPKYFGFTRDLMRNPNVEKVAHNIRADWDIMEQNSMPLVGPTYCTMIGTYVLHPEFKVGLSPASRYYLDDVIHTKWMDKSDAIYNCYDVQFCWYLKVKHEEELKQRLKQTGTDQGAVLSSRQRLIQPAWRKEQVGMLVDQNIRRELVKQCDDLIAEHQEAVDIAIEPRWLIRKYNVEQKLDEVTEVHRAWRKKYVGTCKKHPTYYPGRKPPKGCGVCADLHTSEKGERWRNKYEDLKKNRDKVKTEMKKMLKGFNFKSGQDVAWLLYSPDGLNMPIKRSKTNRPSTNADAIERLSQSKVAQRKEGFDVILKIKEMQQATKAKSTFLEIPIDEFNYVHPPYKVHGTKTGRLASGLDVSGEKDKVSKKYAFNVLNIPKSWRKMYVAPPGQCIVAADWKNQEGRLMAYFSEDAAYKKAFRDEDAGGVDVHSSTAAIIYGIDPHDARTTKTKFHGSMYDMRHCAKVCNHAVSYSPTPERTLIKNFQMEQEEAIRVVDALNEARPGIASYKRKLIADVLGRWEAFDAGNGKYYTALKEPGCLWDANPFGWLLFFYGGASPYKDIRTGQRLAMPEQAGEVCAMRQQTSGAEMWTRCDNELFYEHDIIAMTGTYDSFYLLCDDTDEARQDTSDILTKVMTQAWPELDNTTFPIDHEWGYNLKDLKELK